MFDNVCEFEHRIETPAGIEGFCWNTDTFRGRLQVATVGMILFCHFRSLLSALLSGLVCLCLFLGFPVAGKLKVGNARPPSGVFKGR